MFSLDDLAKMRAQQVEAQPDTAVISRPTRVSDSAGGYTVTPVTVGTVVCRLAPSRPREVLSGNREVTFTDWTITMPNGTDVQAGDTITVDDRVFSVISTAVGSWSTAVRAYCVNVV